MGARWARAADQRGDNTGCTQALGEAKQLVGVADAKSSQPEAGIAKIGPPLLVRRWPERLRANTPAIIWAGALAIQMLAFSTTEGRLKSATAEAEVLGGRHRGGVPKRSTEARRAPVR